MGRPYTGKLHPSLQLDADTKVQARRDDELGLYYAVPEVTLFVKSSRGGPKTSPMTVRYTEAEGAVVNMATSIARDKGLYGKTGNRSDLLRQGGLLMAKIVIERHEQGIIPDNSVVSRFVLEQQLETRRWEEESLEVMGKVLKAAVDTENGAEFNEALNAAKSIFQECKSLPIQKKMLEVIERAERDWERR